MTTQPDPAEIVKKLEAMKVLSYQTDWASRSFRVLASNTLDLIEHQAARIAELERSRDIWRDRHATTQKSMGVWQNRADDLETELLKVRSLIDE